MKENSIEEDIKILDEMILNCRYKHNYYDEYAEKKAKVLEKCKRVLKENEQLRTEVNSSKKEYETYKKHYFCLINRIENKIDKFDYEFEKAKRKNDNDRANYYWDLIRNLKKLLESEE